MCAWVCGVLSMQEDGWMKEYKCTWTCRMKGVENNFFFFRPLPCTTPAQDSKTPPITSRVQPKSHPRSSRFFFLVFSRWQQPASQSKPVLTGVITFQLECVVEFIFNTYSSFFSFLFCKDTRQSMSSSMSSGEGELQCWTRIDPKKSHRVPWTWGICTTSSRPRRN